MPQLPLRAPQCANVNFLEETDSDREYNVKALPNPDNEPQQFFLDLVPEVNLDTGKKIFYIVFITTFFIKTKCTFFEKKFQHSTVLYFLT